MSRPGQLGRDSIRMTSDFASAREAMIKRQIAGRGVCDPLILDAFRKVPREEFVGEGERAWAYEDKPLPIAAGQTISQPYIVARMIEAAGIRPDSRVLEVGAGSGYAAAVIGEIAAEVHAIERHSSLAREAGERLRRLGYANVTIYEGDGSVGLPAEAPFDAIIVSASAGDVPEDLPMQLRIGGRMVVPVGPVDEVQQLLCITRTREDEFEQEELGAVRFVPLIRSSKAGDPASMVPASE